MERTEVPKFLFWHAGFDGHPVVTWRSQKNLDLDVLTSSGEASTSDSLLYSLLGIDNAKIRIFAMPGLDGPVVLTATKSAPGITLQVVGACGRLCFCSGGPVGFRRLLTYLFSHYDQ